LRALSPMVQTLSHLPFADELNEDRSVPRPIVVVDKDNLLPRPKQEFPLRKRYSQGWTHECCTNVGMTVTVMPCVIVVVPMSLRSDPLKRFRYVPAKAGLEFCCRDRCGRSRNKNSCYPFPKLALSKDHRDLFRDVDNFRVSPG
jgi:hypothetical protein